MVLEGLGKGKSDLKMDWDEKNWMVKNNVSC
jgi:hypothetical protein